MLKLRILTAIILIPLVIVGIFYLSQPYFMWISGLITLLAAWEWSRLSGLTHLKHRIIYVVLQAVFLLFFILHALSTDWILLSVIGWILWFIIFLYLLWARRASVLPFISKSMRILLGWLILTLSWASLQWLQTMPTYLLFMLLIIWLADTCAYMAGRLWGRHLLAPLLSPKKTWEGLLIGLLLTCLIGLVLIKIVIHVSIFESRLILLEFFLLIFTTSLAAIAGDLLESQLKRLEELKDSGNLLPGHGGILDRMDSFLGAAPVFAGGLFIIIIFNAVASGVVI